MTRRASTTALRVAAAGVALLLSFPFYWMLLTTFKRTSDLYDLKNNPLLFNEAQGRPTWLPQ